MLISYLWTPITDVKCLMLPGTKLVKINSNLVPFEVVKIWSACVVPLNFYKFPINWDLQWIEFTILTELTTFVLIVTTQLNPIAAIF